MAKLIGESSISNHTSNMDCRFSEGKSAIHIGCTLTDKSLVVRDRPLSLRSTNRSQFNKKAFIFDLLTELAAKAPITKEYALVLRGVVLSRVVATLH